ncbi:Sec1 family protein [Microthyrium microscopicum]|uniref:Sec1 family protein n=1 Tax=Microthyrium microscopicum TaxID=703497 RepID=A0A6A6UHU5_9PEZI|nr:Sec1 family protein [Microthyrium microscopicum]
MVLSLIDLQRDLILNSIRNSPAGRSAGGWKVLVVDEDSRRLIDNVVREDDILENRVTNIDQIEQKRTRNVETDALYILTAEPHIVECVLSDIEKGRYAAYYILWTSILPPKLRARLTEPRASNSAKLNYQVLNIDFNPRESHVVTLRDPYSFPILFHPACAPLVKQHIADLSQRIASVCIALDESPTIRFYHPREPTHEAAILCQQLALAVQQELDEFAQWNPDFAQPSNRPKAALYITDRSMDLNAPFIHEFTYQAMAHDLLPIKEADEVTFSVTINEGRENQETKEMEITDKDKVWVQYRHLHMAETIQKLMNDFQKFIDANPHFANESDTTNLNAIKDMLAGLPQFQEMKEAYSLHLNMAQDCMNIFQEHKLSDLSALEQTLATGLDEDYRKPKNVSDQVVRMLDEPAIPQGDRLRLIAMYIIYRYGVLQADIHKLLLHAKIPVQDEAILRNLEFLGVRVTKSLKDTRSPLPALFKKPPPPPNQGEDVLISRFEPMLKYMLEEHIRGTLDPNVFPYIKPELMPQPNDSSTTLSTSSLRSAKPTWAKAKLGAVEPRQRILVFMAGGATYSEARACYEATEQTSRDCILITSHMLNPGFFLRQLGDLSVDRRGLGLPQDRPAKRAPAHLFEDDRPKPPPASMKAPEMGGMPGGLPSNPAGRGGPRPPQAGGLPTQQMGAMNLNGGPSQGRINLDLGGGSGKLKKESDADKKKKKHLWSRH